MRLVRVAVPVPSLEALTYRVPDGMAAPSGGARVLVPLGNRVLTGVTIGGTFEQEESAPPADAPADTQIKDILDLLDDEEFLPADVVRLASWVAEYYACGAGEAIAAAMPPRAWVESERHAQITEAGEARLLTERGQRRQVLDALSGAGVVRVDSLRTAGGKAGGSPVHAALLGLAREGLVEVTRPLKGSANAYRTVRVAILTAQGHDLASGDSWGTDERDSPEGHS